jgi:hypothetical protein
VLFWVGPVGVDLAHVLLDDDIVELGSNILTIIVVVDAFPTVAFNDIFTQQSNSLVCNLTFTRPLFNRQQILDGVLGAASLEKSSKNNKNMVRDHRENQAERVA